MKKKEIYISVDIEADGPIPGRYSMLSLGAAAFTLPKNLVDTFTVNLKPLPEAKQDSATMEWWKRQPEAWKAATADPKEASEASQAFIAWVNVFQEYKPVFVAYPSGFDFTFVYWYLMDLCKESPFSFSALDIKSYAMAVLKRPYRECTKKNMPKVWFEGIPKHDHVAINDAIGQGYLFCNMHADNMGYRLSDSMWGNA